MRRQGHAYSIFRAEAFTDKNGSHQLVQLRNPKYVSSNGLAQRCCKGLQCLTWIGTTEGQKSGRVTGLTETRTTGLGVLSTRCSTTPTVLIEMMGTAELLAGLTPC